VRGKIAAGIPLGSHISLVGRSLAAMRTPNAPTASHKKKKPGRKRNQPQQKLKWPRKHQHRGRRHEMHQARTKQKSQKPQEDEDKGKAKTHQPPLTKRKADTSNVRLALNR
jgi:hypothetical protein